MSNPRPPAVPFDLADVPAVDPRHLERLMAILIRHGHGLMLLRGADDRVLRTVEAEFWREVRGEPEALTRADPPPVPTEARSPALAAMIRFRAVVDAFAARRLKALLLDEGLAVLGPVFRVAASMRLNAARGFSPQGLVWGVAAAAAPLPVRGAGKIELVSRGTAPERPAA